MKSACSVDVQELSVDVKASTIIEGVGKTFLIEVSEVACLATGRD